MNSRNRKQGKEDKLKTYQELIFWQRSFEVAKLCIDLVRKLPRESAAFVITDQILRSSASVGANIAEGYSRYGSKEYIRFLRISLSSSNETEFWLLLLKHTYPKLSKELNDIIDKNTETIKMLTSTINKIRRNNK